MLLGLALASPIVSLVGCGGSNEAIKPEKFAPKPPPEELSEGGGKRAKTVVPAESD